jgi:hypothetical protein
VSRRRNSARLRGVRTRLLRTVGGVRVYLVDGERIRDFVNIDFVAGSNHGRNKFVPRNEVWVEQILSKHDREATIIHELHERARS